DVCSIKRASDVPFLIAHVDVWSTSIGILKRECAVTPPGNNIVAIPDEATTKAIWPRLRTFAIMQLYKKVLPVPPWPYKKYNWPFLLWIDDKIASCASL
ncbi:hypothetical protein LINGRAHAP2_LOCUS29125, partial [Linum grandiflorum]